MEPSFEPDFERDSESYRETVSKSDFEPEDLSNLPVIELAPLSQYRVDPGCHCPNEGSIQPHLSQKAVEDGASRGCALCIFVYNPFTIYKEHFDASHYTFKNFHESHWWDHLFKYVDGYNDPQLEYYTVGGVKANWGSFYGRRLALPPHYTTYPAGTDLEDKTSTTRAWLSTCLASHANCNTARMSKLPRRVLDLSSAATDGPVRIRETDDEYAEYACLSHCWGPLEDSGILRLVHANLPSFLNEILWSRLPRTFRDAILFVRGLGIRYLWIDSLCIIQDDAADWDREAAKMADIYMNCVLSIAAMSSGHADGGLFANHDSLFKRTAIAYLTTSDGERRPIYTRWKDQHILEAQPNLFPLSVRAWVLQERLLAPRTVYFNGSKTAWECRELGECECGDSLYGLSTKEQFWADRSSASKDIGKDWNDIVTTYTTLHLTFGKDTLPALSGLAKRFSGTHGDEYLAGLWRKDIFRGLLWSARNESAKRAQPWRAPSWSWASLDRPEIRYFYANRHIWQVDLVSVSCEPSGPDPTGAISSGRLVLRGKMMDGTLSDDTDSPLRRGSVQIPIRDNLSWLYFYADTPWRKPGDDCIAPGTTVKVFLMAVVVEVNFVQDVCLVLRPSELEEYAYKRIGLLWYTAEDPCPELEQHEVWDLERAFNNDPDEFMDPLMRAKIREDISKRFDAELARHWQVPTLEVTIL